MSKKNTDFMKPKEFQSDVPSYNFATFMDYDQVLTELIWPGDPDRFSIIGRSGDLFVMNQDNKLQASNIGITEFMNYISRGRFFARDNDGYLRQIQVDIKDERTFEFSISNPVTTPKLTAPSFWTKVFAFFGHQASKDTIQAYNDARELADALHELAANPDYNIKLDPPQVDPDAPVNVNSEASNIIEAPENTIVEPAKKELNDAEKKAFVDELNEASKFTADDVRAVLDGEDPSKMAYEQALSNLLIAKAAQMLLATKNVNLNAVKPVFEGLKESAKEFVSDTYWEKAGDVFSARELYTTRSISDQISDELIDKVNSTGLNDLLTYMNKEEKNMDKNFEEVAENIKQAMHENPALSMFK